MTDVIQSTTTRRLDVSSDAARARIRARYRSEARFKAYGVAALVVTAVFLVILFVDILTRGLPAFTVNSVTLDVPVTAELVDPGNTKNPAEIARTGDFQGAVRQALLARFPDATSRDQRRRLAGLISTGGAETLRAAVVADPSLIGQTVRTKVLLSDDADLYYKGAGTKMTPATPTRGIASPSATTGEITILSSSNDFSGPLLLLKQALATRAGQLKVEADRVERASAGAVSPRVAELRQEAQALEARFNSTGSEVLDERIPSLIVAINDGLVKATSVTGTTLTGQVLLALRSTAEAQPGAWRITTYETPEANRRVTDQEIAWLEDLRAQGAVDRSFNTMFFTSGDSREPELAGIRGALVGSILMLLVTLALCLPIGVAAAIYLEEFAPKNRFTAIIEVNINNLAAVPSIVFGLLGLAVFLNAFGLPRSAPLVGGLVLALLVLPTIIIAARAAIKAVPPSIKEAALGVGASHQQAVFHHVLPLAMPGIMTGTIIGMAHALGETAPLLMIGMVAFIVDIPTGFTEAATALPVQIYLWSDLPEIAFQAKTAAAIIVLMVFLFMMNGAAIWLRKRFERRW